MEASPAGPSTVVVILGASEFPELGKDKSNPAFLNSAARFMEYLLSPHGFGLEKQNLLDLFNADEESPALDSKIGQFLRDGGTKPESSRPRDVIIYYVGHGTFDAGNDYFLALKKTRKNQPFSGYAVKALAQTLREEARHCRKYLILDCCFAAKAFKEFQSEGVVHVALQKTGREFEGRDAGRGTSLLCAAGPDDAARAPENAQCTMFSTALLDVLQNAEHGSEPLTLYQIRDLAVASIEKLFPNEQWVRPEVHSPNQPEGDIARLRLFPTMVRVLKAPVADPSVSVYCDALDSATFDVQPRPIQCVVVLRSEAVGNAIPLQEYVRRAWEFYGKDITDVVSKYRLTQKSGPSDAAVQAEKSWSLDLVLSCLYVDRAFTSPPSLQRAVEAISKADVAVFDTTDFEQADLMLLLGIRSIARRGVTICSVGGEYVIGGPLTVPFNLQMLNLGAHSAAQGSRGDKPRDLIGKKIINGFRELTELPEYLDLPAYDSVRRFGLDSTAYRSIPYYEQVLFLCPFSPNYSDWNWDQFLREEISGKLKDRFRKKEELKNAEPRLVRLMDLRTPRLVIQTLYESIRLTDMCIIDWTNLRPNVMFEAGARLATNPLGAVHIVEEGDKAGMRLGIAELKPVGPLVALFNPLIYACKPGRPEPYTRMVDRFEQSLNARSDSFEGLVYRTVGSSLDYSFQSTTVPVVEELTRSASLLLGEGEESSGICPVLYHDVNKRILDEAQDAAAERRIAAWLYLERRFPDADILINDRLYTDFRKLGAQARRWLKKKPDPSLDDYIKARMKQIKRESGDET